MPGEQILLDPTSEATGTQLTIDGTTYVLMAHEYPTPNHVHQWASSPDTEGELPADEGRYENRTIPVTVRVAAASDTALLTAVKALQQKIGKMARERGTYRRVMPSGDAITFDTVDATINVPSDKRLIARQVADIPMQFLGRPFGRGAAVTQPDHAETTLPALIWTETGIKGDVPAGGVLVVDNDGTLDWSGVAWGVESNARYDISASTGALFYEAEGRTALGGSTVVTGPAGASGGATNNALQCNIRSTPTAVLSTQASGGGAHLTHVGTFRVFARVQVPFGVSWVRLALDWSVGGTGRTTRNPEVGVFASEANFNDFADRWCLVDLGLVQIQRQAVGHSWEARLVTRSGAVGFGLYVDWLALVPVDDGSGIAQANSGLAAPTTFTALDEFDQVAGALTGKAATTGGTWAGAGDADDFAVETTGKTAQRTAVGDIDLNTGRYATLGTATPTAVAVRCDVKATARPTSGAIWTGVIARYVNTTTRVVAHLTWDSARARPTFSVDAMSSGTIIATAETQDVPVDAGEWLTVQTAIDTSGNMHAWLFRGTVRLAYVTMASTALATGGVLASGKVGIYDVHSGAGASTRNYDAFSAWVPTFDQAVYAGRSLTLRSGSIERQDATGTKTGGVDYEGDHLRVPAAGQEGRSARFIVKPLYHPEAARGIWLDDRTDDLSARLTYTPRYLVVPEP